MNKADKPYRQTLSGSIKAGMGAVFSPGSRRYYILEHKITSKYHRAGEAQEIIVDNIELGRDSHCQVRFDESFVTVSRHHAAIVRDGDMWKLVQVSKTNSTLLNGRPVTTEWYLQNGDEIQLSVNGPKLGFIIPAGKKGTVGSIALTRRLSLFRQQALRPYKTALAVLATILLLLAGGGGYAMWRLGSENSRLNLAMEESVRRQTELQMQNDSISREVVARTEDISRMEARLTELSQRPQHALPQTGGGSVASVTVDNDAINRCIGQVYFIASLGYEVTTSEGKRVTIECGSGDDKVPGWCGTGFMLDDGRFVTAHHVVEPWFYPISGGEVDKTALQLNIWANNGCKVEAVLVAMSSTGKRLTLRSSQFSCIRSGKEQHDEEGHRIVIKDSGPTDYAVCRVGGSGLPYNGTASRSLDRGVKLTVLGFPLGIGADSNGIKPIYGSAITSADGLTDGMILTTDTNYEHGNSGGPVLMTNADGDLEVVGIVSGSVGNNMGLITPISVIN